MGNVLRQQQVRPDLPSTDTWCSYVAIQGACELQLVTLILGTKLGTSATYHHDPSKTTNPICSIKPTTDHALARKWPQAWHINGSPPRSSLGATARMYGSRLLGIIPVHRFFHARATPIPYVSSAVLSIRHLPVSFSPSCPPATLPQRNATVSS